MSFKCATNCANRPFYLIVKSFSLAQLVLNLYRLRKLALTNRPFYLIVKSLYLAGAINCTLLFSFQNSERQDFPNFSEGTAACLHLFKSVSHKRFSFQNSERQDLNLRPLPPQGSALPSCATSRKNILFSTLSRRSLA